MRFPASALLLLAGFPLLACSAPGGETDNTGPGAGSDSRGSGEDPDTAEGGIDVGGITNDGGGEPDALNEEDCDNILEIIVRDFSRDHPDFGGIPKEDGNDLFIGDVVRRELVQPTIGPDRKPVFLDAVGCGVSDLSLPVGNCAYPGTHATMTSAQNFEQWYRDTPGVNQSFDKELVLEDQGDGVYVYDTAAFFPLGVDEGFGAPVGDASDNITPGLNFLFTTEIHLLFEYVAGQEFTFRGDDDLWVFINDQLALDLGSMHLPAEGTIDFDAQAEALEIRPGQSYSMDIFHAERRWNGSNFRIETNISCFIPVTEGIVR